MADSNINKELKELTEKWAKGLLSEEEELHLEQWYSSFNDEETVLIQSRHANEEGLRNHMLEYIRSSAGIGTKKVHSINMYRLISIAALLVIAVGITFFFYHWHNQSESVNTLGASIGPGGNKAYLTLGNGTRIALSDAQTGNLASQGNTVISKINDGSIRYEAGNAAAADDESLNTINTPNGGVYHLVLADSTQVWLNAASSITYPVAFKGHERKVSITGEVYFEVAHNAAKPFRVTSRGQEIEVLGTHFNVNAYDNEPVNRTTLLEGSVKITTGKNDNILKPGQQAVLSGSNITIREAAVNEVIAWKDGYFEFENVDIQSLMRQIARWYDVDVQFEGPVSTETFTGRISKFKNISQILSIVEASKSVHITISGRRIMVKQ